MIKSTFRYLGPFVGFCALYLAYNLFQSQILFKSHQYQLQNLDFDQTFQVSKLSDLRLRDEYLELLRNINLGNEKEVYIYHQLFTKHFGGYLEPNRLLSHFLLQKKEYTKAIAEINMAIDHHPYFYGNYFLKSEIEKQLKVDFKQSLQSAKMLKLRNQNFRDYKQIKEH